MSKWKAGVSRRRFLSHFLPSDISKPSPHHIIKMNMKYIHKEEFDRRSICSLSQVLPNHGILALYGAPREYLDLGSDDFSRTLAVSG